MGENQRAARLRKIFAFEEPRFPEGNEGWRIARYIREGAMAFLVREYKVLAIYAVVVFGFCSPWKLGLSVAGLAFLAGAFLSLLAGFFGMKAATFANVRTAEAARSKGKAAALVMALDGGAVMGLCVAGLGLIGMGGVYFACTATTSAPRQRVIHAFAVGASSSIALFARIGGGIYTKAADVGADIVGKVEANIPEDDPRNPGVIADNVGDNVGDIAGMGADIYESYVAAIVASDGPRPHDGRTQLAAALAGRRDEPSSDARGRRSPHPARDHRPCRLDRGHLHHPRVLKNMPAGRVLRLALIVPPFLVSGAPSPVLRCSTSTPAVVVLAVGAIGGAIVGLITDYYTSMGPVAAIAEAPSPAPAPT
jgi:K(+)-stimulated pyrophosphate-energized sodium pump